MADFIINIRNDLGELSVAADAATRFLERNQASSEVIFAANLAIEEIVTNIITYGYEDSLTREITVRLALREDALEIEICDDGKAFDPFRPHQPGGLRVAREAGGLGIHLVRNMLDACAYARSDGRNIVKLTKKLRT